MAGGLKVAVQRLANRLGYQIRRIDQGVDLADPYVEQRRILGEGVRTVFEVGAYDGRDALRYAEMFPEAHVFAFEPVPESFALVASKAAACPRITGFNVAVADEPGHAEFHLSNWIDASSLLRPKATGSTFDAYQASSRSITVPVDTLDAVCAREGIDRVNLLKMDAQGAELRILHGATALFARGGVDMVYAEVHFIESYEGAARFDQVMAWLLERGLRFHSLYGVNHNHRGQMTWADALFVHPRVAY
jgi:FkbM family methyltransferase